MRKRVTRSMSKCIIREKAYMQDDQEQLAQRLREEEDKNREFLVP
jgi:hypothetical protein